VVADAGRNYAVLEEIAPNIRDRWCRAETTSLSGAPAWLDDPSPKQLYKVAEQCGADRFLLAVIDSWSDTLSDTKSENLLLHPQSRGNAVRRINFFAIRSTGCVPLTIASMISGPRRPTGGGVRRSARRSPRAWPARHRAELAREDGIEAAISARDLLEEDGVGLHSGRVCIANDEPHLDAAAFDPQWKSPGDG